MRERPGQAVVLAGGRGTRLKPLTDSLPKAMIPFHGRPFLEYLVELLRDQGFERVLMLLGYRAQDIVDHFGDGRRWHVTIEYDVTEPDDLTSHRMRVAAPKLDPVFLLLYCDNYWPMRFEHMWEAYARGGAPAQVTVYANADDYSRDGVRVGADGVVELFDRSRSAPGLRGVEIGYAILERDAVLPFLDGPQRPFEEAVYPRLIEQRRLRAYMTDHRYYSVGDHRRLPLTASFLERRPTVLLDRDGVLNARPPQAQYVTRPEDVRWLPGALEALALLSRRNWRVIVLSNQAGVGRGVMTARDVDAVNERMRRDAEAAGGRIDAFYYCPHDWDEGCLCRKPRPGLLLAAQRDFQLDLTRTAFVGDDERDAQAAEAAGAIPVLLPEGRPLADALRPLLDREEVAA